MEASSLAEKLRIALWISAAALAMAVLLGSGHRGTAGCATLSDGSWFHREYCSPAYASDTAGPTALSAGVDGVR